MNNKAFTFSLVLAGLAVFMLYSFITSKEEEIKATYGTETAVVVAKKDIIELSEIYENMVEIVSKPKRFIEPGKTTSKQEVVGFIAAVPIRKNEQITLNKIIAPGVRTGLSKQITPGKRAIAFSVNDANAVSRLIKPGDRIDIIATIDPPGGAKGSLISKFILQDVPVLSVGEFVTTQAPRKVERDELGKDFVRNLNIERNFNTVTIEVEPRILPQLAVLIASNVPMMVSLRHSDDTERVNVPAITLLDVLGADSNKIIRGPATQR